MSPQVAYAAVLPIVASINREIVNPTLEVVFMAGLVVFMWGLVEFLWHSDSDQGKEKGKAHMLWGVIGMFIMVSAFGLLTLIINTIDALIH